MGPTRQVKSIGIIPARGGSKNIKNKNLIKIGKKNLIEIAYVVAKKSRKFHRIVCSTDSEKIINFCKAKKIPFIKRPAKLAKDNSNVVDAVLHVLNFEKKKYDIVGLLQPTSPFLKIKNIRDVINFLEKNKKHNSCQTVHKTPHNYHYLNTRILKGGNINFKFEKLRMKKFNKQKKTQTYNFGNFLACRVKTLLKTKNLFCNPCYHKIIDRASSYDLDSKDDLIFAKFINRFNTN